MYAKVTGSTPEKVIESIDRYVIAGMKTEIDTVLNTVNSEQFRAALQTITKEFNANAIANYSEVLK
jgi:molybdenum cofactor biosynthesis enzyme MoaA